MSFLVPPSLARAQDQQALWTTSVIPYNPPRSRVQKLDYVFCPPLLGKPNPLESRPAHGPDTRNRVIQKANPGMCCSYYAVNMIRDRFKAANSEALQLRKHEKVMSSHRKALMLHDKILPDICSYITNTRAPIDLSIKREDIDTPQSRETISKLDKLLVKNPISNVIDNFRNQNKYNDLDLYLYYLKYRKIAEIFKNTIKQQDQIFGGNSWAGYQNLLDLDHSQIDQYKLILVIRQQIEYTSNKLLGLQKSKWDPRQSFGEFKSLMQTEGPLVVRGHFGSAFYNASPIGTREMIGDRRIYGWPKDSRIPYEQLNGDMGHAILLVGAQKFPSKNVVYFVDPNDESDPAHPEKQKIYAMSYETLTNAQNIKNNLGVSLITEENELEIDDCGYGFALVRSQ